MLPSVSTGKIAPITTKTYEGGNIEIDTDMFGNVVYRVASKEAISAVPDYPRHLNHFSNCPNREQFGRQRI